MSYSHLVIWWLSQEDCEQLPDLYEDVEEETGPVLPGYIIREVESRYGRAGRGRLWIPTEFDLTGIDWDDNKPMAKATGNCGGIVILVDDAKLIAYWPGFVTDLELNLYRGEG